MVLESPTIEGDSPVVEIEKSQSNEEYGGTRVILPEYARTIS